MSTATCNASVASICWTLGDTLLPLRATLRVDGNLYDLTGNTVVFRMEDEEGNVVIDDQQCVIEDAEGAQVLYYFKDTEVDEAGSFKAWFIVQEGGAKVGTWPQGGKYIEINIG